MEGFKSNPKMKSQIACFKEGGYVTKKQLVAYEKKEDKAEEKKDMAEDKKVAKKAIAQHETAKHKGEEKTEIKLKKGGRSKKESGNVRKYKAGGDVKAKEKKGYAKGGFFNEEPDSDLATPSKRVMPKKAPPKARPLPSPLPPPATGQGQSSDAERQMIMQQFQGGPRGYADGRMVAPNDFRPASSVDFGPLAQQALSNTAAGNGVPAPALQLPQQASQPATGAMQLPPQANPMAASQGPGMPQQANPMAQANVMDLVRGRRPF